MLLLFLLSGCELLGQDDLVQVDFSTDKQTYLPGETIRATLTNSGRAELHLGACIKSIDGEIDGVWSSLYQPGLCESSELVLKTGGSHTFSIRANLLSPATRYRVTDSVNIGDKTHLIESNLFTLSE